MFTTRLVAALLTSLGIWGKPSSVGSYCANFLELLAYSVAFYFARRIVLRALKLLVFPLLYCWYLKAKPAGTATSFHELQKPNPTPTFEPWNAPPEASQIQ